MTLRGEMASALVIGGGGFLGSRAVAALAALGWRIVVVQRGIADNQSLANGVLLAPWDGQWPSLRELAVDLRPKVVINLAAHFVAEHAAEDIEALLSGNLHTATYALEAARCAGARGVVTAGSFWEDWSDERPVAVNLYAAMKRAGKELTKYYCDAHGLTACHIRFSDIYGPSDPRRKLFHHLRAAARSGQPLAMSPGNQLIDLVHVEDAARAVCSAAARVEGSEMPERSFEDVAAFSGRPLTLKEVVALYEKVVARPVPVLWGQRSYRDREVMRPHTVPGLKGWSAALGLERGIEDMERSAGGLLEQLSA